MVFRKLSLRATSRQALPTPFYPHRIKHYNSTEPALIQLEGTRCNCDYKRTRDTSFLVYVENDGMRGHDRRDGHKYFGLSGREVQGRVIARQFTRRYILYGWVSAALTRCLYLMYSREI